VARTEVDLRGLRVDEMETELSRALDQAVVGGLSELRIIHGKGTGALRARAGELLSGDSRVREFRTGRPTEGGTGVTVAVLG
jgi:DNA mismatch repair protein MutS2